VRTVRFPPAVRRLAGPLLGLGLLLGLGEPRFLGADDEFAGRNMTASKFHLQQPKADGALDWELFAQAGVARENSLSLTGVRVVLHRDDGDNLELRTSVCTFDRLKKQGRGDKPVNIRNRSMVLDGVGFDFDANQKTVVIRSRVHVTILRRGTDPLAGLTKKDELGEPAK
jgi:hypothetical protein